MLTAAANAPKTDVLLNCGFIILSPSLSSGSVSLLHNPTSIDAWQVLLGDRHPHGHQWIDHLADPQVPDQARQHVGMLPTQPLGPTQGRDHVLIGDFAGLFDSLGAGDELPFARCL